MVKKCDFVIFNDIFLEKSFSWLNDEEIKWMTQSGNITIETQMKWYQNLTSRKDYFIWGIVLDNIPIGAVGIKNINYIDKSGEYFGYIGEKEYWGLGLGSQMVKYAFKKAIDLGLDLLTLSVVKDNKRAIRLYEKNGFIREKLLDNDIAIYKIKLNV